MALGETKLYREQERICRGSGNKKGLAAALWGQALIIGLRFNLPRKALPLEDEAYRFATECDYTFLAKSIELIRRAILRRLK